MRLIFIAPPGAGKGTQSALITEKYGTPAISTGNLLRAAIKNETELGKEAKQYIEDGNYVPDEVVIELIKEAIMAPECQKNGFILDGYPRTEFQALTLGKILVPLGIKLDAVIILYVPKTVLIDRLSQRRTCLNCGATYHLEYNPPEKEGVCGVCGDDLVHRKDDRPGSIKTRISNYNTLTKPIIKYYKEQEIVYRVNGMGEIDQVNERIDAVLSGLIKECE